MIFFVMACQSFELFKNLYEYKEIFLVGIVFLKERNVLISSIEDSGVKEERALLFDNCHCPQLKKLFESSQLLEKW